MTVLTSPHSLALSQISPITPTAQMDAVAMELDLVKADLEAKDLEMHADTCTEASISRWENKYGLSGDGSFFERKLALRTAIASDTGIAARHYAALADAIGFNVSILRPNRLFRVGVSHVGNKVFSDDELYTWGVSVPLKADAAQALVQCFEDEKIPFTSIRWSFLTEDPSTLLRLDEAEVSMLCIDGSDGKNNAFQLHPNFDDAKTHPCQWSSSDATKATVSSTGVVTGVAAGSVTITCTHLGISKSCDFTVYTTLPSEVELANLPGCGTYYPFMTAASFGARPNTRITYKLKSVAPFAYGFWNNTAGAWDLYSMGDGTMRYRYANLSNYYDFYSLKSIPINSVVSYAMAHSSVANNDLWPSLKMWVNGVFTDDKHGQLNSASQSNKPTSQIGYYNDLDPANFKLVSLVTDSRLTGNPDLLLDKTYAEQYNVYQNWIRYTDHDSIVNHAVIPNIGTGGSQYDLDAVKVPDDWFSNQLLRLDEAEVSMLCIDGSDGKNNAFQLHPNFDDAKTHP